MKANKKQMNKIFKDMKVEPVKEWRQTTSRVVYRDRKKQTNKYSCRKKVL
jgi:hypothetical protein